MKKSLSAAIVMGSLLSPLALNAQSASTATATASTESTKVAPLQSILPNAYGNLNLRHYFNAKSVDSTTGKLKYDPVFQPRLYLGSKFFDGKLDSKFIFAVNNSYGEGKNSGIVTDKGTRFENDFTAYKNDYVSLIPFLYVQLPKSTDETRGPTKAEMGLDIQTQYPIATSAGTITFEAEIIGKTLFGSKPDPEDRMNLRNKDNNLVSSKNTKLSLTDSNKKKIGYGEDEKGNIIVDSSGRTLYHAFSFGAGYKPSFVSGFEVKALTSYETTLVPVMEENDAGTASVRTSGGRPVYQQKFEPSYIFSAKYAFSPEYSITNEFTLLDKEQDSRKYSNLVSVVAKLF